MNHTHSPSENSLRFTQNFLHKPELVRHLVDISGIRAGDTVLEIGPGAGIITHELAQKVGATGSVITVELDRRLAEQVQDRFREVSQVTTIHQDILEFDLTRLPKDFHIFSNVPFSITAKVLDHVLTPLFAPQKAFLILQRETLLDTERPGKPRETFKSLLYKPLYEIELLHEFSRSDFSPQPSVETAFFGFTRRKAPLVEPSLYPLYVDFLSCISRDRAGEGAWLKIASKKHLKPHFSTARIQIGKGLKSQSLESLVQIFHSLIVPSVAIHQTIKGAAKKLRAEQDRRERITFAATQK